MSINPDNSALIQQTLAAFPFRQDRPGNEHTHYSVEGIHIESVLISFVRKPQYGYQVQRSWLELTRD